MTPDVNVLVAASRSDHPYHKAAAAWLTRSIASCDTGSTLRLMPMVVASFLRLVTSPKIFKSATPIHAAVDFVDALLAIRGVELATVGTEWPTLRRLCLDKSLHANDVPDAWLAAAVVQTGEHLATFDADFRQLLSRSHLTVLPTR